MTIARLVFLVALLGLTPFAHAQAPSRPVRIIVPFAAGGSADVLARITGQALAARCPRQLRIEDGLIVSDQMVAA
jgi:tripartite-type tricarboxylate transporter receptor subunit TctC